MINVLERFDKITAAGLLARAALSLREEHNPAATPLIPDETGIRAEFLAEIRSRLTDVPADGEAEALDDALDVEIDALLGDVDESSVFEKLGTDGRLPSDLYRVEIHSDIEGFWGLQFVHEKVLILTTVASADREQHLGPETETSEGALVSLFSKFFVDCKYSGRSFTMLVVGVRDGERFFVHQAWRIYPDQVELVGTSTLVQALERFAQRFGVELTVSNQSGKFILQANVERPGDVHFSISDGIVHSGTQQVYVFAGNRRDVKSGTFLCLAIAIDLHRYRNSLRPFFGTNEGAVEFSAPTFMRSRWLPSVEAGQ